MRTSARRVIAVVVTAAALVACGETVDLASAPDDASDAVTTVVDPFRIDITEDAAAEELLDAMLLMWRGLGERVIDGDRADEAADRIAEWWRRAEPTVRSDRPELLFGFEQAVELARSSVERRRPADASKGYKLAVDLTADYAAD